MNKPITYLRLQVSEYCGCRNYVSEVSVEKNCLYCRTADLDNKISDMRWNKVHTVQPNEWNDRLGAIGIRRWQSEYRPPEEVIVLDGTQWEIHFTAGQHTRHIYGDNAFPEKWEALEDFMIEVLAGVPL